ncbi:hypothetical protein [Methylobacterium nigriterrae]|uniref:hypothetical protein n=1 Tax=Methylobacterium nigriterrae TaxID=3127512 RepID=UPI00301379EC
MKFDIRSATKDAVATNPVADLRKLVEPPAESQEATEPKEAKAKRPAARKGGKGVTIWLDPDVWYQLRLLSLKRRETTQDMVAGWISRELEKAGSLEP